MMKIAKVDIPNARNEHLCIYLCNGWCLLNIHPSSVARFEISLLGICMYCNWCISDDYQRFPWAAKPWALSVLFCGNGYCSALWRAQYSKYGLCLLCNASNTYAYMSNVNRLVVNYCVENLFTGSSNQTDNEPATYFLRKSALCLWCIIIYMR